MITFFKTNFVHWIQYIGLFIEFLVTGNFKGVSAKNIIKIFYDISNINCKNKLVENLFEHLQYERINFSN